MDAADSRYRPQPPSLARWPAVLAGAVLAFVVSLVLLSLWTGFVTEDPGGFVDRNLAWFEVAAALGAAAVGGFVAGWAQPVRGAAPGALNGVTTWGVLLFAAIVANVPTGVGTLLSATGELLEEGAGADAAAGWAPFTAYAGGLAIAGLAGALGGLLHRHPVGLHSGVVPVAVPAGWVPATESMDSTGDRFEPAAEAVPAGPVVERSATESTVVDGRDDSRRIDVESTQRVGDYRRDDRLGENGRDERRSDDAAGWVPSEEPMRGTEPHGYPSPAGVDAPTERHEVVGPESIPADAVPDWERLGVTPDRPDGGEAYTGSEVRRSDDGR